MFLLGYFRNAARCKCGKIVVMVWAGDGSNLREWGGLMLWSSQRYNTNQGQVGPNWSVNMPVHNKGALDSAYLLLSPYPRLHC